MKITRSPESVRALLLQDPHTAKITQELGISPEEYVQKVVDSLLPPSEEKQRPVQLSDKPLAAEAPAPRTNRAELEAELESQLLQVRLRRF